MEQRPQRQPPLQPLPQLLLQAKTALVLHQVLQRGPLRRWGQPQPLPWLLPPQCQQAELQGRQGLRRQPPKPPAATLSRHWAALRARLGGALGAAALGAWARLRLGEGLARLGRRWAAAQVCGDRRLAG